MCIGMPMQVIETAQGHAWCQAHGRLHRIDTLLVGDQPVGTWLLTFLGTAREVLSAQRATQINAALQAVDLAMQGDAGLDHLFPDLVDREPQLPAFLRRSAHETTTED